MAKRLIVHDPYRNKQTTLTEFAKDEGVLKRVVSHYFWYHQTLEGFRKRPPKGGHTPPHVYTYKGKFVHVNDASRLVGYQCGHMAKWRKMGITEIEEIRRIIKEQDNLKRYEIDSGERLRICEFAAKMGVSYNTVASYYHNHKTLKGFEHRGHSRVNPKLYLHSGLGAYKSIRAWGEYYGVQGETIKNWLKNHGGRIDGFENRRIRKPKSKAA